MAETTREINDRWQEKNK